MARYYAEIESVRGIKTHHLGHREAGAVVTSWKGAVRVLMYADGEIDRVRIETVPWRGQGASQLLFDGPLAVMQAGAAPPNVIGEAV